MRKHRLAISLAAVGLAAAAGGGAYAATQDGDSTFRQSLIADVAHRLHVTPSQLTDAVKAAMVDQIDGAVKAGRLTQAEANELKQRIQQEPGIPFGLPEGRGLGFRGMHSESFFLGAAASYLGLSTVQLRQQLESGKSLAQVAGAQHKSVSRLEQAITSEVKSRLDQAVASGRITKAQEQAQLSRLHQRLPNIVNRTPPAGRGFGGPPPGGPGPGGPEFRGPPGAPGPGGAGGYGGEGGPNGGGQATPPGA